MRKTRRHLRPQNTNFNTRDSLSLPMSGKSVFELDFLQDSGAAKLA
jgi:hypothetical protein